MQEYVVGGKTLSLRTYGSPKAGITSPNPDNDSDWDFGFPGPTFHINPGDHIKMRLYNRLPVQDPVDTCNPITYPATATPAPAGTATATPFATFTPDPGNHNNCFHGNNVTNFHFHGFHVPQGPGGDDVLLALYPAGQGPVHAEPGINVQIGDEDFEFDVPMTQAEGTHWYHPHSHGSTDLQVSNGMSGAFIVQDTLNNDPVFQTTPPTEYVLVIQDIMEAANFVSGGNAPVTLINGQSTPNIPLKAGEVQRWRLVNATGKGANLYQLNFDGPVGKKPEIYLIAADGVFIGNDIWDNETPVTDVYLAPGNRIDLLVRAPEGISGHFSLNATSLQTQKPNGGGGGGGGGNGNGGGGGNGNGGGGGAQVQATPTKPADAPGVVTLISTTVSGTQSPAMSLPESLPSSVPAGVPNLDPIPDSEIVKNVTVTFSLEPGTNVGKAPVYLIDGQRFDPCRVDHCMVLNTAEEWTIQNTSPVAHPFHIHLNPFFIKEFFDPNEGLPDPGRRWQDTIIIPPAKGDTPGHVVIRHRFPDITGPYVLHCHILGHEDRGMMQLVEVVATEADCAAPTCQ